MLIILSPAKKLADPADTQGRIPATKSTQPVFLKQANELAAILKDKSKAEIAGLMNLSEKLASLNYERYQHFSDKPDEASLQAALLAFQGDVYANMQTDEYAPDDFAFAQQHVRILSGLYGLLRPLDKMQLYRLEMGTKLATPKGENLYDYWGERLSQALNKAAAEASDSPLLINLASQEYFSAVDPHALTVPVITPVFKDRSQDKLKVVGLLAKRARGAMTDMVIRRRLTDAEQLKQFDWQGYAYRDDLSSDKEWVFTRDG